MVAHVTCEQEEGIVLLEGEDEGDDGYAQGDIYVGFEITVKVGIEDDAIGNFHVAAGAVVDTVVIVVVVVVVVVVVRNLSIFIFRNVPRGGLRTRPPRSSWESCW